MKTAAMKAVAKIFFVALIAASQLQLANAAGKNSDKSPTSDAQKFTGVVSDSMCGAKHMMKDPVKCTRECVKGGSDYALVVGDKVYTLKGDKAKIDKFAGESATVQGKLSGETITV